MEGTTVKTNRTTGRIEGIRIVVLVSSLTRGIRDRWGCVLPSRLILGGLEAREAYEYSVALSVYILLE